MSSESSQNCPLMLFIIPFFRKSSKAFLKPFTDFFCPLHILVTCSKTVLTIKTNTPSAQDETCHLNFAGWELYMRDVIRTNQELMKSSGVIGSHDISHINVLTCKAEMPGLVPGRESGKK